MEDMDGANDARLKTRGRPPEARSTRASRRCRRSRPAASPTATWRRINAELQQLATTYPDKVKLFTLNKTSLLGKTIYGVEVSHNVAQNVGKPAFLLTGAHHAREWPTAEFTMEFIWDLLMHDGTDADAKNLLEKGKLIAVPVVNPDGYDLSRSLQNEQKRKNCRITSGVIPTLADCMLAANVNRGIDLNRNYLPFWGGPGSSTSATASNTRGEAPGSEPEIAGMIDLGNSNQITVGDQQPHARPAPAARAELLQRARRARRPGGLPGPARAARQEPPGLARRPVDRRLLRGLQHRRAAGLLRATARSASRPRRRRASAATQTFHPPYQNVIDNYLGTGTRYAGPDDARALLRRLQGGDRARAALRDHRHRARGRDAHAHEGVHARQLVDGLDDRAAGRRSARSRTRSRRR